MHDAAIEQLLASGERRRELVALLGESGYRQLSDLARRARDTRRGGPPVYVLPGLMGSRIGTRGRLLDDVIWLDLVELAAGHLTRLALPRGARLAPLGVMLLNALKLKLSLQVAGFDARLHPFDWRRSVEDLAQELNARIAAEGGREVMLVGHSMGGVVARIALAGDPGHVARVVQLGSPNLGSFAPVLALRAVYPTVRKLAALDLYHDAEDLARIVFRTLPSLHELLPDPGLGGGYDLFDPAAWPDDALRPEHQLLADAAAARARWPAADPRCLHIVGVRQETVTRAALHGAEFRYTLEHDGDGTVPRSLAMLPGAAHWFIGEKHGGLPNNGTVIGAVVDLLRHGSTERLPATARRSRVATRRKVTESTLRRVAPRKLRWQDLSPDARRRLLEPVVSPEFHGSVARSALQAAAAPTAVRGDVAAPRTIELRLVHGSIADASARAIVLGLFRNVDPSGAANAVDARLGGLIRQAAHRRMFDASLGRVTSLPVARGALLADFVVLAGLGDFDDFGSEAQSLVAGNIVRLLVPAGVQDFATVLFGAGSGVPVAAALEQQLGGFVAGLRGADDDRVVRRITLCEIDARKYAALRRAAVATAARLSDRVIAPGGGRRRHVARRGSQPGFGAGAAPGTARRPGLPGHHAARAGARGLRVSQRPAHRRCQGGGAGRQHATGAQGAARATGTRRIRAARAARHGALRRRARPVAAARLGARRTGGDAPPAAGAGARRRGIADPMGNTARRRRAPGARGRPHASLRKRDPDGGALERAARPGHAAAGADDRRSDARPAGRSRRRRGSGPHAARRRRQRRAAVRRGRHPRRGVAGIRLGTPRRAAFRRARILRRRRPGPQRPGVCQRRSAARRGRHPPSATCRRWCSSTRARLHACAGLVAHRTPADCSRSAARPASPRDS